MSIAAKNHTLPEGKQEKFYNGTLKAAYIGFTWWLARRLAKDERFKKRSYRGDLLVKAAQTVAKKKKWPFWYRWMWTTSFANVVDTAETDNAYSMALYQTLEEYAREVEQHKLPRCSNVRR